MTDFTFRPIGRKKFILLTLANYTIFIAICMILCHTGIITGGRELVQSCSLPEFIFNTLLMSFLFTLSFSGYGNTPEVSVDTSMYIGLLFMFAQYMISACRRNDGFFNYYLPHLSAAPIFAVPALLWLAIRQEGIAFEFFDFTRKIGRIRYLFLSLLTYALFSILWADPSIVPLTPKAVAILQEYELPGFCGYILIASIPLYFLNVGLVHGFSNVMWFGVTACWLIMLLVYWRCNSGNFNKRWCFAPLFPIANIIVLAYLTIKKDNPPPAVEPPQYPDNLKLKKGNDKRKFKKRH